MMRKRWKAGALLLACAGMPMHGLRLWVSRTYSWVLFKTVPGEMQRSARLSGQPNLSAGMQLALALLGLNTHVPLLAHTLHEPE